MYKILFLLFLTVAPSARGQIRIVKTKGAEIVLEGDVYDVIGVRNQEV